MIKVFATREGLVGKKTALGWAIDSHVPFVALPSYKALDWHVRLRNPANGLVTIAWVADVGPWNTHDDEYVLNGARPQAETGTDLFGRKTNHAGIDLGERVRLKLAITVDNLDIEWERIQ